MQVTLNDCHNDYRFGSIAQAKIFFPFFFRSSRLEGWCARLRNGFHQERVFVGYLERTLLSSEKGYNVAFL